MKFGLFSIPSNHRDEGSHEVASPSKPLLMSMLDSDANKLKNSLASDPNFSKNWDNIQRNVYKGLYMNTYVSEVEITPTTPNTRLLMMIDGRLYGGFGQIKVSQLVSKDNKKLMLNIKSFTLTS